MPPCKALITAQLAAACVFLLAGAVRAEDPAVVEGAAVPYDKALGIIQANEQAVKKSKWAAHATWGKLSESSNGGVLRTPNDTSHQLFDSKVYFDPGVGKYRCDFNTIGPWVGGASAYIKSFSMESFDGNVERNYEKHAPTDLPPTAPDRPGDLVIEPERAGRFLSSYGWHTGIGSCSPYFANFKVSELVKNTVRVHGNVLIREASPEVWLMRVQDPTVPSMAYNLTYDLGKGGLVTAATWDAFDPNVDKRLFGRYTTELGQTGDGHFYPKMMLFDQLVDKLYRRVDLTEFEYGSPYDDSVYQFDCPPGTNVEDKVGHKFYMVGRGPTLDHDQTVAFMQREGLSGEGVKSPPSSFSWWTVAIAAGAAVLLAVLAVTLLFWKPWRRRGTRAALVLILVFVGAGRAAAAAPEPVGFTDNQYGGMIYVSQCGFNARAYAPQTAHILRGGLISSRDGA